MKKVNIYFKAGIFAMAAEILIRAVSFLSTTIYSRILPIDVYGNVRTFESWLSILFPTLSLGLFANIDTAKYRFHENLNQYVTSIRGLIIAIHAFIGCVVLFLRGPLEQLLDFSPAMLMVSVLYSCFYSCFACTYREQRSLLHYKNVELLSMMEIVPPTAVSIICCLAARDVSDETLLDIRIVSFYAPIIFLGMAVSLYGFVRERTFVRPDYWNFALKTSIPLIMYQISLQILMQSDRIMIKRMVGAETAAIFSMATTVIYIVEIIHKGFETVWIPWLYKMLSNEDENSVNRAVLCVQLAFGLVFLYMVSLGKEAIMILGGKPYMDAIWLLGPMLGGVVFQFLMLRLADIEKFYQKENYVGIISIVITFLNLVLNYLGIRFFGYRAAAYTTMLSYIAAVVVHLVLIRAKIPAFRLPGIKIFVLCCGIAGISLAGMGTYRLSTTSRYAVIAALTLLLTAATMIVWRKYGEQFCGLLNKREK